MESQVTRFHLTGVEQKGMMLSKCFITNEMQQPHVLRAKELVVDRHKNRESPMAPHLVPEISKGACRRSFFSEATLCTTSFVRDKHLFVSFKEVTIDIRVSQ